MAGARLVKTSHSGIFKREAQNGTRYVVVYRDHDGRQRKETARTLDDARALKRKRESGETNAAGRLTFAEYAREWVERHHARESTREDYRRHLEQRIIPFIGERRKLADVTPLLCNQLVAHLKRVEGRGGRPLADSTIGTILKPLGAALAQARAEGLIPHNPAQGLKVPKRETVDDDDEEEVRALTEEQLATFLALAPTRHRLTFRFLAATGLRFSELVAVQWRHLELDGSRPRVRVRRAIVRGRVEPPKTRHGRRDVPLAPAMVDELRAWRRQTEWPRDEDLVFCGMTGEALNYGNLRHRALVPTAEEAGVPWVTFHTFRHTCASLLFARGRNAKQVQRWLGHHSAAFTLDTYIHLLSDDVDEPLELPGGNKGATAAPLGGAGRDPLIGENPSGHRGSSS
jgi:integrase